MTDNDEIRISGPRLAIRVAELLRLAHAKSGLTQKEIARRLDVGEARVSQILNGDGNLHIATIARAFAAMDFDTTLKAFDSEGEELQIPRRPTRRRPQDTVYHHTIESPDGKIHAVRSWAYVAVDGRHVEAPMREEEVPEIGIAELEALLQSQRKGSKTSGTSVDFALETTVAR